MRSPRSSSRVPRRARRRRLARSNVNALMDSAPAGAEANLRAVVASMPGVTEVRALRVRSSGGKYFADVVIGVDRLAGLERSHAVMDEVERVVEHELGGPAEVSVHAEPLAADERPSERVVAAALRVPGRDRGAQRDGADAARRAGDHAARARRRRPAAARRRPRITQRLRAEIRRETGRRRRLHPPRAARARRGGGLRRHRAAAPTCCERVADAVRPVAGEPEEVLVFEHDGRYVVVLRVRAVPGQSVADAHALAGKVEEAVRARDRRARGGRGRGRPVSVERAPAAELLARADDVARAHARRRRAARGLVAADRRRDRARLGAAPGRARERRCGARPAAEPSPATTAT